jgi:hypothetical protein
VACWPLLPVFSTESGLSGLKECLPETFHSISRARSKARFRHFTPHSIINALKRSAVRAIHDPIAPESF